MLQYGMMLLVSFNRKLVPRKILLDAKKPLIGILLRSLREEYHADLLAINPDRNFCLRVAPKPYQWHAYNEFIQKMSQRDPLKKIILSFFFCNSLVSRRYPWSVPFPFFGSLSTLRKIHDYPVIVLTRRNFPLPFKAGFTLRSLNG